MTGTVISAVIITHAAVSEGTPPIRSAIPIAIGTVTDSPRSSAPVPPAPEHTHQHHCAYRGHTEPASNAGNSARALRRIRRGYGTSGWPAPLSPDQAARPRTPARHVRRIRRVRREQQPDQQHGRDQRRRRPGRMPAMMAQRVRRAPRQQRRPTSQAAARSAGRRRSPCPCPARSSRCMIQPVVARPSSADTLKATLTATQLRPSTSSWVIIPTPAGTKTAEIGQQHGTRLLDAVGHTGPDDAPAEQDDQSDQRAGQGQVRELRDRLAGELAGEQERKAKGSAPGPRWGRGPQNPHLLETGRRSGLQEMGVWGPRPQRGPGAEPLAFLSSAAYSPTAPARLQIARMVIRRPGIPVPVILAALPIQSRLHNRLVPRKHHRRIRIRIRHGRRPIRCRGNRR